MVCDGTVRQQAEAAKLKPWWVWVRLPLVLLDREVLFSRDPDSAEGSADLKRQLRLRKVILAFGRAVGRQTACKAVAFIGNVGSIPTRGTGRGVFSVQFSVFSQDRGQSRVCTEH